MKVVILAGGYGTRISEESHTKPKPMIDIGEKPIIWHIMKYYLHFGFNEFIICLGYKGFVIKEFFSNYYLHMSDVTFNFKDNSRQIHRSTTEPWKVTLVDTGPNTPTGGRINKIKNYIDEDVFMLTYGDGVSDVDINALYDFHKSHGKIATVTAIRPKGKFGTLKINNSGMVDFFQEKPDGDGTWINGGYFVLNKKIFEYLDDSCIFEKEPIEKLTNDMELMSFCHKGFWQCMDTQRDRATLEQLWSAGAPWKVW